MIRLVKAIFAMLRRHREPASKPVLFLPAPKTPLASETDPGRYFCDGWRDALDQWPHDGQLVETSFPGVYSGRICRFWRDQSGNAHFGRINEPDGKGSQPARFWRPVFVPTIAE